MRIVLAGTALCVALMTSGLGAAQVSPLAGMVGWSHDRAASGLVEVETGAVAVWTVAAAGKGKSGQGPGPRRAADGPVSNDLAQRPSEGAAGPTDVGTDGADIALVPDFVIPGPPVTSGWAATVTSQWLIYPQTLPVPGPVAFRLSGPGNPTLLTADGRRSEGEIAFSGTNILIDAPRCGETFSVVIHLEGGLTAVWKVSRPEWPAAWGPRPEGC